MVEDRDHMLAWVSARLASYREHPWLGSLDSALFLQLSKYSVLWVLVVVYEAARSCEAAFEWLVASGYEKDLRTFVRGGSHHESVNSN